MRLLTATLSLSVLFALGGITTPASADTSCTSSAANGTCQFPAPQPEFQGTEPGSSSEVDQNIWNAGSSDCAGWSQTLTATDPQHWTALANYPTGNTAVCAFTNTWAHGYDGSVDSYPFIQQHFRESFPHDAQTTGWAMDDLWFNNWGNEVMVQYDFSNNGPCQSVAEQVFGGQAWHLCVFGTQKADGSYPTEDWKLGASDPATSETHGVIHVKKMIQWLETNGYLPAQSPWTAFSAGFEICGTNGPEPFSYSKFTIHT